VCLVAAVGILTAQPENLVLGDQITEQDLAQARKPLPPVALKASPAHKDLDLRGDAKTLFERVAHEYDLTVIFDTEYVAGAPFQFRLTGADYQAALRALEAATGSFVFPVTERLFMVAKDTPQKRQDLEPNMAVVCEIPAAVSVQEVQELARAVQMTLQIQRLAVDAQRGLVLINDRISKVRPAQAVFAELMHQRPQVMLEMELLEVDQTTMLTYGLLMPAQFTLSYLESQTPLSMLLRGGPAGQFWGLTLGSASLIVNMTDSNSRDLFDAEFRAVDGQPGSIHIGERYPIASNAYLGQTTGTGQVYVPPPTFTFEDLGLSIKVTPRINDAEAVTLEVEASFKVLTGQSLNGLPIISNRAFLSKAQVRNGEWAVIGGLLTVSDVKTISGMAGVSNLPGLRTLLSQTTRNREKDQVLILLKPSLLNLPPSQFVTSTLSVGSEMRPRIPL
jgi:type II secretory pathway component GspD/PulD (secretin)